MHWNRLNSSALRAGKQQPTFKPVTVLNFGELNRRRLYNGGSFFCNPRLYAIGVRSSSSNETAVVESDGIVDVCFQKTYPLRRTETVCFSHFD